MAKIDKLYKDIDIDDIINWCVENDNKAWLVAKSEEQKEYKVYPRKDSGKKNKKGYPIYVADKSQSARIEIRNISFIELKYDFCKEFMPEILPKSTKEKKPTMFDKIAALKK